MKITFPVNEPTESDDHAILRIYAQGDVPVTVFRELLAAIEDAYNSSFVFDQLMEKAINMGKATGNRPPLPISTMLWHSWWPPTPIKVAAFVPDSQKLVLKGVLLQSPGFLDLVGCLNPLQTVLTYLNDRDRLALENRRSEVENRGLEIENRHREVELFSKRIDVAEKLINLGIMSHNEAAVLKSELLGKPYQALGAFQDKGMISTAEFVEKPSNSSNDSDIEADIEEETSIDPYGASNDAYTGNYSNDLTDYINL